MMIRHPQLKQVPGGYLKAGLIGAAIATSILAGQDSSGIKRANEKISFEQAFSAPELRQEYLDQRMEEWRSRCAASYVYDPSDTMVFEEIKSRWRYYLRNKYAAPLLFGTSYEHPEVEPTTLAFTATYDLDLVGGHKPSIFVRPIMFDFVNNRDGGDGLVGQMLAVHEEKHACDTYDGLEIHGRRFSYGELLEASGALRYVLEIRAYGAEIGERGLDRKDNYHQGMINHYSDYFDLLVLSELESTGAWAYFDYRIPSREQAVQRLRAVSRDDDDAPLFMMRMSVLDGWGRMEEIESRGLETTKLEQKAWLEPAYRLHLNLGLGVYLQ